MFGKLLKNDLKAQWHSFTVIFICILIVGGAAEAIAMYSAKDFFGIFSNQTLQIAVFALSNLVLFLAMVFACIMTIIAVAITFSNSTYGKTGYLTHTLPVKTSSLIWSKTITGLIWTYVVFSLLIISVSIFLYQFTNILGGDVKDLLDQILVMLFGTSLKAILNTIIYLFFWAVAIIFLLVQSLYFAITCSHCKPLSYVSALFAIFIFFGVFITIFGLSIFVYNKLPFGILRYEDLFTGNDIIVFSSNVFETQIENYRFALPFIVSGPIFMLMASIGLSFPTIYLTKHKINVA
jgi:hypothetical protein